MEKLLKTTEIKNEKYNKIVVLAKIKLNSIESIISEAPINNEMCREDFTANINEEKTIDNWKNALEWWKVKELILKKLFWLRKVKEKALWNY